MIQVFCRDSRGEIVVMNLDANLDGEVAYRSSEAMHFVGPFQVWIMQEGQITRKFVDQAGTWWLQ